MINIDGPFADDFTIGEALPLAPSITVDAGVAAAYQAVTGDPLRLPLSAPDSAAVTGHGARLVNPALVLQVAIGQSTVATRRVIANLFYRDVALHRQVHLGDTLTTKVTPVALALTRPGSSARRAKVLLRMETVDQDGRVVALFERLALLPCRDAERVTAAGEVGVATADRPLADYLRHVPATWDLARFPETFPSVPGGAWGPISDPLVDTVSSALELVRLTLNQAAAHRDPQLGLGGRRLVYGGHAIGLAQASLARTVPGLVTVLGWRSCDHLAPVFEGDVLEFRVERIDALVAHRGVTVAGFRVVARVRGGTPNRPTEDGHEVLDWRPVVLLNTTEKQASGPVA